MQLDFVIPGLFDRLHDWSRSYATLPTFPTLERALSVAATRRGFADGFEATIWQQYDPGWQAGDELPSAGHLSGIDGHHVFHASAVHLEAGMRDLILTSIAPLTHEESDELHQHINQYLQPTGIRHHLDDSGNGYLVFDQRLTVRTTPLSQVVGTGIADQMPSGDDAARLHQLGNELQMLLHSAPFNQRREREGKLTANAIWLWGGGEAKRPLQPLHELSISNHPLPQRCAQVSGQQHMTPPERFEPKLLDQTRRLLVVHDGLMAAAENDDIHSWQEAVARIEQQWIAPMVEALRSGALTRLTVIPCHGKVFSLSRRSHWKIWRQPKSLAQLL